MVGPLPLHAGWSLCATLAGAYSNPVELSAHQRDWLPAQVPGTVAGALRTAGKWSLQEPARQFDAEDWWYRLAFELNQDALARLTVLEFAGLATLADVWLNGERVLAADNMHRRWRVDVRDRLRANNELLIRCRSLDSELARKRPRPRWRTPMVAHQQLRWVRTTLLGRTPGWSPPAAVVGPWRAVQLWSDAELALHDVQPSSLLDGDTGVVRVVLPSAALSWASAPHLCITRDGRQWQAALQPDVNDATWSATLRIPQAQRWWPHTHGEPALYDAMLIDQGGAQHALAAIGFRDVRVDTENGGFDLQLNGRNVFARGACWTPLDVVTLNSGEQAYADAIAQARSAGFNMLRVGGTMVYEADAFYRECDRQGMLVWQDFMFANMDYPHADAAFTDNIRAEAREFLQRRGTHACLAVLCGNSEVEQQAAMCGALRDAWLSPLFHEILPALNRELCPQLPYWPSSTHGGAFPHEVSAGTTSYYGLGAYLRDPTDARRAGLRFATECLAFANIPEPETIAHLSAAAPLRPHSPLWKERSPRDLGAGWDFDDVRDHYLRLYFGGDPMSLRYSDPDRYLACGRAATAAAMRDGFAEWRRPGSGCGGALVWFLRDLWDGAGWGLIDADGTPKAPWHALAPLLQPLAIWLTDEGNNGAAIHVANEGARGGEHKVRVRLYRDGAQVVERGERAVTLHAGESQTLMLADCFDHWLDVTHAFRFGPPLADLVHAVLVDEHDVQLVECSWLPLGLQSLGRHDLGLTGRWERDRDGSLSLRLSTRRYAHAVRIDAAGYQSARQYFDILPGREECLYLQRVESTRVGSYGARVQALNGLGVLQLSPP